MPTDLPIWQKNVDERYFLTFKADTTSIIAFDAQFL